MDKPKENDPGPAIPPMEDPQLPDSYEPSPGTTPPPTEPSEEEKEGSKSDD